MSKVQKFRNSEYQDYRLMFVCPGCRNVHFVDRTWKFNNDFDKPTFSPSILTATDKDWKENRCHSFIKDGKIRFLNDCHHKLKGQTVDLIDVEKYLEGGINEKD